MLSTLKAQLYYGLKRSKGSRFETCLKWFMAKQYQPYEVLQREQDRLMLDLLETAYVNVPGYRERLEDAHVFHHGKFIRSNFHEVTPLTRQDLVFNAESFLHQDAEKMGLYFTQTGGSTGSPVKIGQNHAYRDWAMASTSLFYQWSGLRVGTPYFLLWAASQDFHSQLNSWRDQLLIGFLQGRRILNCKITSPDLLTTFIRIINRQRDCHYLVGYANELYALACHSQENNLLINRRLKAVYATAMNLTPAMRETIESVFGCKVYNRYGSRDVGDMACECPEQNGLHINPLYTYVEVVDEQGQPLPPEQEGEILVTNLHNRVMPLIRYAIGDRGIMKAPERCGCGREWPTLMQITGRTSEKLYLRDGARFGGACLYTAFEHLPGLRRFQIHQYSPTKLHIKLRSCLPDYTERYAAELAQIAAKLESWVGYPMQITFEQAEMLDRTPSGKELMIVHHFDPNLSGASLVKALGDYSNISLTDISS